jgi:hypothetical protein
MMYVNNTLFLSQEFCPGISNDYFIENSSMLVKTVLNMGGLLFA